MKNILKSIGAVLLGIIVGALLSYATDYLRGVTGVLPYGNLNVAAGIVIFVILYRTAYNVIGCYIIARLAPNYPMGHAMVAGVLGFVAGILGTIATAHMNVGPLWYGLSIAVISLPSAWLGAKWAERAKPAGI